MRPVQPEELDGVLSDHQPVWSGHLELGLVGEGVLGVDRCGTAVVVAGLEAFHVDLPHVLVDGPGDPTLGRPAPLKNTTRKPPAQSLPFIQMGKSLESRGGK